jgi:hypothetical protein
MPAVIPMGTLETCAVLYWVAIANREGINMHKPPNAAEMQPRRFNPEREHEKPKKSETYEHTQVASSSTTCRTGLHERNASRRSSVPLSSITPTASSTPPQQKQVEKEVRAAARPRIKSMRMRILHSEALSNARRSIWESKARGVIHIMCPRRNGLHTAVDLAAVTVSVTRASTWPTGMALAHPCRPLLADVLVSAFIFRTCAVLRALGILALCVVGLCLSDHRC